MQTTPPIINSDGSFATEPVPEPPVHEQLLHKGKPVTSDGDKPKTPESSGAVKSIGSPSNMKKDPKKLK